ncbi:LysR family transcriptional regulator [Pseudoroseomonas rhizosphaerae]|uniref:LysR family transcriptional regulator n=1 Tax=Teichococcus rhizosphaerae TaxID=1335062 RepID=A0A2C7A8G0_9PROT|nr:LysR family transcriptional regulator [Pseudoroseomonas rhizosphaerae]PHK94299.1 LysR family transcriptional regulator [Pseudoroseomonas rhizosphaerae]
MEQGERAPPAVRHLRVAVGEAAQLGPGKADLLQAVAELGSISAAGRATGMSYARAWRLLEALEAGFGQALVQASRGGSSGGGARLTPLGEAVLAAYRRMQAKAEAAVAPEVEELRALLRAPR